MSILTEIRDWMNWAMEAGILYYVAREFYYDRDKDMAKKQRKTKTTKRVTTEPSGASTTEETVETVEPSETSERSSSGGQA